MKKVLIIIGKLSIGGAERVGRDIGFHADSKKFEIHYLVFGDDIGAYEAELQEKGCRIIHMDPPRGNHLRFLRELKVLLRREKYDVIHSHTMFNSGWAMLAGKRCGVPVRIAHSHSIRGNEKRGFVKNLYEKTMRCLILRYATHYVACGEKAGQWLFGEKNFAKKGILIYNGIGLDKFAFSQETCREIRREQDMDNRFVIGHVGHLAPVKNQRFLLQLMPEILKIKPNALLVLLGEGSERTGLEAMVRELKLEESVRMLGNVDNVHAWLNAMDVFAFPSFYEGMPLAMIEAQTNGLPCVISDRIPGDVHLTDLITTLPLEGSTDGWVEALCTAERNAPERYAEQMRETGFDTMGMLSKLYALYEGDAK